MATYGSFNGSFLAPWGNNTDAGYATAVGGTLAQAPAQFGQNKAQMYDSFQKGYGTYNQGLGQLGQSYAQNYAAMAGGIGGIANALGNTWNNAQANNQANSAAEASRQAAISNLGTAAMANYGNASNGWAQAWGQNQNGYQKSLSDMNVGNQQATSQLGVGRYNALAGLGKSGAAMSVGRDVAAALPGLAGNGGTTSGGGGGEGFGMLNGLRGDINNGAELSSLNKNYYSGLNSLNADQAIARNTPREMVNSAYGALMDFNRMNLGASQQGMNQFYDNAQKSNSYHPGQTIPTGSLLDALAGGYTDSAGRIGGVQRDMNSGWNDAKGTYKTAMDDVNKLYNNSIGNMGLFRSEGQIQNDQFAMQAAAQARSKREAAQRQQDITARFGSPANYAMALGGYGPTTFANERRGRG
jgi:hypothetical protein